MTVEVTVRTEVAAPARLVWESVTDWAAQGAWMPGTVVRVIDGDDRSVGSRVVAFTGVADVGVLDPMRIVEWDPPRRCRVRHLGKLLRGTGEFTVLPAGDTAAVFVWSERLEPPFGLLGRIGLPLAAPVLRLGMRRAARRFAAVCVPRQGDRR